jgi:hypothetical protein
MAMLAVSGIIGMFLGIYGRVLAVIPALAVVLLATAAVDAGAPLLSMFVHIIVVCAALEFCYLVGVISPRMIRDLVRPAADADGADPADLNHRDGPLVLSN